MARRDRTGSDGGGCPYTEHELENVEKAIANLKRKGLLSLEALASLRVEELAEEIRPAGYFNVKAGRLKNLAAFVQGSYNGRP